MEVGGAPLGHGNEASAFTAAEIRADAVVELLPLIVVNDGGKGRLRFDGRFCREALEGRKGGGQARRQEPLVRRRVRLDLRARG